MSKTTIDGNRFRQYATDPSLFRADLMIEASGNVVRLGDSIEPWQDSDFRNLDGGWLQCVGRAASATGPVYNRAYLERPRGHSKTSDLAVMAAWALVFASRPIHGYAFASDRDQSKLLKNSIQTLVRLNPWLESILTVNNWSVKNTASGHPGAGSELEIQSSDVASSWGLRGAFYICDEVTVWPESGADLCYSISSSAAKQKNSLLLVISNAGNNRGQCWQWDFRENARTSDRWYFNSLDGPQASWIDDATLESERTTLPRPVFGRCWLNQWQSGGDALEWDTIKAAVKYSAPMSGREPGWQFLAGLDLGVKSDHSALVVLGVNRKEQSIRLALCQSWAPGPSGQVDLEAVRAAILFARKQYYLQAVHYDPFQAALMAQQLQSAGVKMREVPFVGQNLHRMASTLLESFRSKRIELYDDKELLRDLTRLTIEERSFGWKLTAARTSSGHADRAIALAIALPAAVDRLQKQEFYLLIDGCKIGGEIEPADLAAYDEIVEAGARGEYIPSRILSDALCKSRKSFDDYHKAVEIAKAERYAAQQAAT